MPDTYTPNKSGYLSGVVGTLRGKRTPMPLTDLTIRRAQPKDKPYKLYDAYGLFLLINPSGSKLWRQKFRVHGKERLLTHGAYPKVSLREARSKRDDVQHQLDEGIDPSMQRKLAKIEAETEARNTFKLVADEYIEAAYERELADATIRKKIWHVETLAAPLHNRAIRDITAAEVLDLLRKVERSGRRETAKKLRGTLSGIFRLAVVTLRADNDPTQAIKGALLPVKVTNRAAITDEAVFGQFLRDLEAYTGSGVIKDALLFQILTMTRPGEARGARKAEIDFERRTWTLPESRMKMRRAHIIPLGDKALELARRN